MADIDVQASREMKASPEAIWAVMCDLGRLPEWLAFASAVEDVSGSADPAGATDTVKPHKSYEPTTKRRAAEVDLPVRQLHTIAMPMISGVTSEIELTQSNGATVARVHWQGTPSKLSSRLMSRRSFQKRSSRTGRARWRRSTASRPVSSGGARLARL